MSKNLHGEKYTCPSHPNFPIHPNQTTVHRVISIIKNDFEPLGLERLCYKEIRSFRCGNVKDGSTI